MTTIAADARWMRLPSLAVRSDRYVIGIACLAALAFGLLLPFAPRVAIAALVVIPLAWLAPVPTLSILIAVTVLVPFEVQDAFAVIGGRDRPGLLIVDALMLAGLVRIGWLVARRRLPIDRPLLLAMTLALICAAGLISGIALGAPVSEAGHEVRRAALGVGAFVLAWPLMKDRTARRRLAGALVGIGLVLALWGLAQWVFSVDYTAQGDVGVRPGVDLTSSGRGQLQGGIYAYPVAVILAWAALVSGSVRHATVRWLLAAILVLNLACLVLTFERTLWVAPALACAFVAVKLGASALRPALAWATVGAAALLAAAAIWPGEARTAVERLLSIQQVPSDTSFTSRVVESQAVFEAIGARPLTGSGFGSTITWGDQHVFATITTSFVHNGYLWLAWKVGIPAAILLVLILGWSALRRTPSDDTAPGRALRIGSQASVFALLLIALTFSVFDVLGITAALGLLVAVCFSPGDALVPLAPGVRAERALRPRGAYRSLPVRRPTPTALAPQEVEVDVVIPTRDRPDQLAATLAALARQSFECFGVIVVDDGGEVAAEDLVPADLRASLAIRFLRNEPSIGPGASRNRGAEAATTPYLVFLDDDCVADPELVARHRAVLASGDHVVSLGAIVSPPGRRLPPWTHWDADRLERQHDRISAGETAPAWTHLFTGNVGLRREDFVAVGGFDHRFARQEDVELGYRLDRLGCRFAFDPAAVVWHDSDRSLREWTHIPAASAWFDVLMDRLDPESDRLAAVRDDLRDRHWALRLARLLVRGRLARHGTAVAAITVGRVLHAVRADRPALSAFSLAWDLTYAQALHEATAGSGSLADAAHPRPVVWLVGGTRPEALKLAPLIVALGRQGLVRPVVVATGQHPSMFHTGLSTFGLRPDRELRPRRDTGSQAELMSHLAEQLDHELELDKPAAVVVQGDTSSALIGALTAFWRQIPVVHLEAGLRSHDLAAPFPEEANRKMIDQIAALHLAPTPAAAANLAAEGIASGHVDVIGNTVVDAVLAMAGREQSFGDPALEGVEAALASGRRLLLVTVHRRESWGEPLRSVLRALRDILRAHPDTIAVLPAHPNPSVRADVLSILGDDPRVVITRPLDYADLVRLLERATLVLSDSGGIQEEAPTFGVPVLVLRDRTERTEAVEAGWSMLVGTDRARIVAEAHRLLLVADTDGRHAATRPNPFGDGQAGERAATALADLLGLAAPHGVSEQVSTRLS